MVVLTKLQFLWQFFILLPVYITDQEFLGHFYICANVKLSKNWYCTCSNPLFQSFRIINLCLRSQITNIRAKFTQVYHGAIAGHCFNEVRPNTIFSHMTDLKVQVGGNRKLAPAWFLTIFSTFHGLNTKTVPNYFAYWPTQKHLLHFAHDRPKNIKVMSNGV